MITSNSQENFSVFLFEFSSVSYYLINQLIVSSKYELPIEIYLLNYYFCGLNNLNQITIICINAGHHLNNKRVQIKDLKMISLFIS